MAKGDKKPVVMTGDIDSTVAKKIHADQHAADGSDPITPVMIGAACDRNLLDNGNFLIWQRYPDGVFEGVPNYQHIADRFIVMSSDGSQNNVIKKVDGGGIRVESGPSCRIEQRIENPASYNGKTLTMSVLKDFNDGFGVRCAAETKVAENWTDDTEIGAYFGTAFTWLIPGETLYAIKLELGDAQTLAHKEGETWVLNEIPDYGEELRRCQRYYRKIDVLVTTNQTNIGSSCFDIPFTFEPPMRDTPSVSISGSPGGSIALEADKVFVSNGIIVTMVDILPAYTIGVSNKMANIAFLCPAGMLQTDVISAHCVAELNAEL